MIRIRLPEGETQRLERASRREADPNYRGRIRIARPAGRGRPHQGAARGLAVTPRAVRCRPDAHLERGLGGPRPRKPRGAPGKTPAGLAGGVRRRVIEGPAGQGLDRANWTREGPAGHLYKTHGIATFCLAAQRFRRRIGIRVYRPACRSLRGKPEKQAAARQEVAERKGKAEAGAVVLLSQDEARFPVVPTPRATPGVGGTDPRWGRGTARICCTPSPW